MSPAFGSSGEIVIRGKQQFQQANGNIYNYYLSDEGPLGVQRQVYERLTPIQRRFREILQGDIILRSQAYSGSIEMEIEQKLKSTNPFRPRIEVKTVKIRTKVFHTELVGYNTCKFTLFTFEPENKGDKEAVAVMWQRIHDALPSHTSPLLAQVFGLCLCDMPAFISHDKLAHAIGLFTQYHANSVVSYYFAYHWLCSYKTLKMELPVSKTSNNLGLNLQTLTFSTDVEGIQKGVLVEHSHWAFNLGTRSWQYNLISASVSPPMDLYFLNTAQPPSLHHKSSPQLDEDEVTIWLEQKFGDFLYLFTFIVGWFRDPSTFVRYGFLTFGAVIHCRKGIMAHFPSLPSPEWFCHSHTVKNQASYSKQVPSRVDLKFCSPGDIVIQFSLRLPAKFSTAYLSQSSSFVHSTTTPDNDLVFLNSIHFMVTGTLCHDPAAQPTPLYLFVPPIPVEHINGMHCIRYPLPNRLFYWSFDPDGQDVVLIEDYEELGVPELDATLGISSRWLDPMYNCIHDHLLTKGYSLDGKQYARDHDYPELVRDDPHDIWFQAESFSLAELFGENQSDNDQAPIAEQATLDTLPTSTVASEHSDNTIELAQSENAIALTKDTDDPRETPNAANPSQDLYGTVGSHVSIPRSWPEHVDTRPVTLTEALAQLCEVIGLIAVILLSSTVRILFWLVGQRSRDEKSA
ncbi:hypothetical protein PM082_016571 [Marasmius tenuissimus]|nr:hypothetical protein PM082_016571 [Marasmius tenuissimus]